MKRFSTAAVITFLISTSTGYVSAEGDHAHSHHHHETRSVPNGAPVPTLELEAFEDSVNGYNLHLVIENFTFAPDKTGMPSDVIEGHAHLYVNDEKIGRVYATWVHLPGNLLENGDNTVRVTLNDNMHSDWAVGEDRIEDAITLQVESADEHDHSEHKH